MELSTQKCPARWKIWVGTKSCWLICGITWFACWLLHLHLFI